MMLTECSSFLLILEMFLVIQYTQDTSFLQLCMTVDQFPISKESVFKYHFIILVVDTPLPPKSVIRVSN